MKRLLIYFFIITVLIILDQVTKNYVSTHFYLGESIPVIEGFFNLTFVTNRGAAFGMGAGVHDYLRIVLFLVIPVIACFWFAHIIWQTKDKGWLQPLAFSIILSGAIGNLIDRFFWGYVVDFFDFYYKQKHFPAFNIADSAITVGAILLIGEWIIQMAKGQHFKDET